MAHHRIRRTEDAEGTAKNNIPTVPMDIVAHESPGDTSVIDSEVPSVLTLNNVVDKPSDAPATEKGVGCRDDSNSVKIKRHGDFIHPSIVREFKRRRSSPRAVTEQKHEEEKSLSWGVLSDGGTESIRSILLAESSETGDGGAEKKKPTLDQREAEKKESALNTTEVGRKSLEKEGIEITVKQKKTERKKSATDATMVEGNVPEKKVAETKEKKKKTVKKEILPSTSVVREKITENKGKYKDGKLIKRNLKESPPSSVQPDLNEGNKAIKAKSGNLEAIPKKTLVSTTVSDVSRGIRVDSAVKFIPLKEKETPLGRKTEATLKSGSRSKQPDLGSSSGKKHLPIKVSDGRVRSPFSNGRVDPKTLKVPDGGNSKKVKGSSRSLTSTVYTDVATDTNDLVPPLSKVPVTPAFGQFREVQDFLYRQDNCPVLEEVFKQFPLVDRSIVVQLWESRYYFAEETKNRVTVGDMVFEVLDETELLNAIESIKF